MAEVKKESPAETTLPGKVNGNVQDKDTSISVDEIRTEARKLSNLDRFPVEVFPEPIRQIISETEKCLNYPADFTSGGILFAAATVIGNTLTVEVIPGWIESPIIYVAIIGLPGVNKSHPLHFAIDPIHQKDSESFAEYEKRSEIWEQVKNLAPDERPAGFDKPPVWRKFLVSDFTAEALMLIHYHNRRGIGVYVDELQAWLNNFNRYRTGSDQETWISAWNAKPISIDRKSSKPIQIKRPAISVAGTIQDGVLDSLMNNNRMAAGFIDRLLFIKPEWLRKKPWPETTLNPSVISDYQFIINRMIDLPFKLNDDGQPIPTNVQFEPDAWLRLKEWQSENTDLINRTQNSSLQSVYSKLEIYVSRICLILHALKYVTSTTPDIQKIETSTVESGILLTEYFRYQSKKVNQYLSDFTELERLPTNQKKFILSLGDENFSLQSAMEKAKPFEIPERSLKRMVNDKNLFEKISHGVYRIKI